MIFESQILSAFTIGIVSALSLPLGAITSFYFKPEARVIAALMAFGAGALLAALTIDLVASSVAHGHFNILAIGCIIGGLLFIGLDNLVSNFGGFKRKISTSIYHRNAQNIKHLKEILDNINLFKNLKEEDIELLVNSVQTTFFAKESTIFEKNDPADSLYIVIEGEVELHSFRNRELTESIQKYQLFGHRSIFTGSPHSLSAKALSNVWTLVIPKDSIRALIETSKEYREEILKWLQSPEIREYLLNQQNIKERKIDSWLKKIEESLREESRLVDIKSIRRHSESFQLFANRLERVPWLEELSSEEAEVLSKYLTHRKVKVGDILFKKKEPANYLYIIESGEVDLSDLEERSELRSKQDSGDCIGSRAFISGLRHTVTAKVIKSGTIWALRRGDLEDILREHPNFRLRLLHYLRESMLSNYQQKRYGINQGRVLAWRDMAIKAINSGKNPPTMLEMGVESTNSHGASLAIWLGILLDGIPESLVIGANMIHSTISISLVAGLFLSNYPEALSSSIGMQDDRMSKRKILIMWTSIMLFTGVGAGVGNIVMTQATEGWFAFLEGLAAGAMLTMIAQTMLPEAYSKGGSITGFATLMGFLATISLKSLD